jgi:glycosyltransferase involved in cell wall biosynthesis
MRIGIGVCSYRRPREATYTCNAILAEVSLNAVHEIETLCSLDDADTTGYEEISEKFGLISSVNGGVAVNKNRLLERFVASNRDVVFLIEDDLKINTTGWLPLYLAALEQTRLGHINWLSPDYRKPLTETIRLRGFSIGIFGHEVNGVFMVMTRACLEHVGRFDEQYGRYGAEHMDYSRRCFHAGLYPNRHPHILEASDMFSLLPTESCLPATEKNALATAAMNRLIAQERARLAGEAGYYLPVSSRARPETKSDQTFQ